MGASKQMNTEAEQDDPWIGVHVLTEFIFCPRAGVLEFEKRAEDEGEEKQEERERDRPRLDFDRANYYELHSLEKDMKRLTAEIKRVLPVCHALAAILSLTAVVAAAFIGPIVLLLIPLSACSYFFGVGRWRRIAQLARQRRQALAATPAEPDPAVRTNQPVDWWRLIQAGFESVIYKDPLRYETMRLVGRPWRVLRRGSLRIPVFRKRQSEGVAGRELRRQHFARMAAYCLLLEKVEGGNSPYGIVLFGESYEGVAIPVDKTTLSRPLCEGLELARRIVRQVQENHDPDAPGSAAPCRGCHHGKPFVHRPGESEHRRDGRQLPVLTTTGADERRYHSACGDRFYWVPPHSKAFAKGLRA
jgi:hypothetical protein